ncbi:hypothetical protein Vadar_006059 [Vaccinium darrowii]|uniref:Uncharacterized protein n=1 Tax=Vaccinium darrowii TaxID=229202 RepID=A0ACB7X8B1_9ERIC|nr:hypothetical protein Vadar_006059 [Vaccinium darrowii]
MEITSNNENTEAEKFKAKSWIVLQPPQTRLQKQAPAALRLDQMVVDGKTENTYCIRSSNETPSCRAIPLLSPLVLSPTCSREGEEEQLVIPSARSSGNVDGAMITPPHSPDSEAFPDGLFSFFQMVRTANNMDESIEREYGRGLNPATEKASANV